MDGAALLALIAAVGFGWQPMPDGSERYEYIVQVDQDLAATLAAGKSIPIVGEVPEGIHPIARVRVVVGEDSLPRERLVTRLKPVVVAAAGNAAANGAPDEQSIVVRGQNAVAPNPYVESGTSWNSGAAGAPAPSSQQLFDNASAAAGSAWNDNVAAPATQALNNASQGLQNQVVAPVQQGINDAANQFQQSVGQNVQSAAASLGDRTKSLVNELAQPLSPQPAQTARGLRQQQASAPLTAVAPPATGAAMTTTPYNAAPYNGASAAPPSNWNQEPPSTNPLRAGVDPSASAQAASAAGEWNSQPPSTGFPAGAPLAQPNLGNNGVAGQPLQQQQPFQQQSPPPASSVAGVNDWNSATTPVAAGQPAAGNGGFGGNDPWQGVPDPRTPAAVGATSPGGALAAEPTAPYRGAGTGGFPTTPPLNGAALGGSTPNISPPNVATPGIDRNMLSQAPNRPLDGSTTPTNGLGGVPAASVSTGQGSQQAPAPRDIFATNRPNPATPAANAQQPTTPPQTNLANASGTANGAGVTANSKDNAVITLVAWVLLFGSAFGNLYLFWSYLDVRQKYRSLVRKTARAVGSRFSAA
ncbi:MAG: hypothetical protein C0485_15320 [Pirellula sp.]|nr:hypothetical protein [Pirellula sp.]